MQTYIYLAFIFAVGRALVTIYQKFVAEYIEHDWKIFTFIFYFSTIIMAGVFYLVSPWTLSLEVFKAVLSAAIPFFLGGVCLYYSLFNADVSIVGGLQPIKLIPLIFLTSFLLGETFSVSVYVLIGVLVVGSFLVVVDEKVELSDYFNLPIFIVVISSFLFALSDVMAKKAFNIIPPISFMSANMLLNSIFSLIFVPFIYKKIKNISWKQVKTIAINSVLTFTVVIFLIIAFETNVTISNVISNLTGPFVLIFTIITGKIKPHFIETRTKKVYLIRVSGAIISYLATVGIIILTV